MWAIISKTYHGDSIYELEKEELFENVEYIKKHSDEVIEEDTDTLIIVKRNKQITYEIKFLTPLEEFQEGVITQEEYMETIHHSVDEPNYLVI